MRLFSSISHSRVELADLTIRKCDEERNSEDIHPANCKFDESLGPINPKIPNETLEMFDLHFGMLDFIGHKSLGLGTATNEFSHCIPRVLGPTKPKKNSQNFHTSSSLAVVHGHEV